MFSQGDLYGRARYYREAVLSETHYQANLYRGKHYWGEPVLSEQMKDGFKAKV